MNSNIDNMIAEARKLHDIDKLALVDALLVQLDRPDVELDSIWAKEARRRREAFLAGHITVRDYEDALADFPRP